MRFFCFWRGFLFMSFSRLKMTVFPFSLLQYYFYSVERSGKCDVTLLMGSGEWLATPLRARRQAVTGTSGRRSPTEAVLSEETTAGGEAVCRRHLHNFDRAFPLKWRITVRTKLPRTSTRLRTRAFCGISFRGEWGGEAGCFAAVCLSLTPLRSAVKATVDCSAERKRVGLGWWWHWMFHWQLVFLSSLSCSSNYYWLTAVKLVICQL